MASLENNLDTLQKDKNELNGLPATLEKLKVDTLQLSNFLCGMRLKPIPLDMPQTLTTTEWLMTLTENVNMILEGYNDFDEKTKTAIEKTAALLDEIITSISESMQMLQDNNEYLNSNIETINYRSENVEKQVEELDQRLTAYITTGTTVDTELVGQIKDIVNQWSKVLADISRNEFGISELTGDMEEINRTINNLQRDLSSYSLKASTLEKRLDAAIEEMGNTNAQIPASLESQIYALKQASESLSIAMDTSKSNVARLNSAIETLQSHQSALETNVLQWQNQINLNTQMINSIQDITSDLKIKTTQIDQMAQVAKNQSDLNTKLISQVGSNQSRIIENARSFSGKVWVNSIGADALGECLLRVNPENKSEYINTYTETFGESGVGGLAFPTMTEIMKVCQFVFEMDNMGLMLFADKQPIGSIDSGEKFNRGNYFKLGAGYHTIRFTHYEKEGGVSIPFTPSNEDVIVLCRVKDERVAMQDVDSILDTKLATTDRQMTSRNTNAQGEFVAASVNFGTENTWELVNRIYIPYENDLSTYSYYFIMLRSSTDCYFKIQIDDYATD